MNGIILLDKPAGITSFKALGTVKRACGTGRVGHAGTLDRFASGLLVAAVGVYTRLLGLVMAEEKEYRAEVWFGRGTDTFDPEGRTTAAGRVPAAAEIEAALPGFRGRIMQRPPAYSAVHVNGERAWRAARKGVAVEPAARPVTVHELECEEYDAPVARLRIVCSRGTYVRALARDIAAALGTCAHLSALSRTRIGGFTASEAVAPPDFNPARDLLTGGAFAARLSGAQTRIVAPGREAHLLSGKTPVPGLFDRPPGPGVTIALDGAGNLVAVLERRGDALEYLMTAAGA